MRTSEKNKKSIYVSLCLGTEDELDEEGLYTGNVIKKYSSPTLTKINMYPANGSISRDIFGENARLDMMMVTVGSPFSISDVFTETDNISSGKYDYYVSTMKKSLNNTYYGLTKRV